MHRQRHSKRPALCLRAPVEHSLQSGMVANLVQLLPGTQAPTSCQDALPFPLQTRTQSEGPIVIAPSQAALGAGFVLAEAYISIYRSLGLDLLLFDVVRRAHEIAHVLPGDRSIAWLTELGLVLLHLAVQRV